MPPNGSRGSDFTRPFTKTAPASMRAASRSARPRSRVHSEAPRPNGDSLARRMASASSLAWIIAATGPKVSSSKAGMPGSTAASSGGGDVGVVQHDERIAAAELQHGLLQLASGLLGHLAAGVIAAGQGDRGNAGIGDEPGHGARAHERGGEEAGREAGVPEHLGDGQ